MCLVLGVAHVVAQGPGNCNECTSPTGCPGLCVETDGRYANIIVLCKHIDKQEIPALIARITVAIQVSILVVLVPDLLGTVISTRRE
jgi:hypothetical protein